MRNENYDRELLVFVTLFCTVLATAVSVLDASPTTAKAMQAKTHVEQPKLSPVRIIGTPFLPNANPSIR